MVNTSSKYKELINQSGRMFYAKIVCTFPDGSTTTLTDRNIMQNSFKISEMISGEGAFEIGCAIINELDFEIDNSDGTYNNISFDGAEFKAYVGLAVGQSYTGDITAEWLNKGIYTAEQITVNENYISVIAYDYMGKFDVLFSEVGATFPIKLSTLFQKICTYCGAAYGSLDFPNKDLYVTGDYLDEKASCREVLSYIAQLACSYVYADKSGYICMGWLKDTDYAVQERQKINGTVTVTGVQLTDAADNTKIYQTGTKDYCLIMDDNPFVVGNSALQNSVWTNRLVGKLKLTPFEAEILSDPSLEAGDIITVSDLNGNTYKTPITSINYSLDSKTLIVCDAETLNENQRTKTSPSAKIISVAKREAVKQISEYDIRAKQFSMLTANAMGYYQTVETDDSGAEICYQHDKPLLSESKIIWKKSLDSFAVSTDGGETWKGMDSSANAVLNILAVEGIVAEWIKTGTLEGIEIIATIGSIAGWEMSNGKLISSDGTMIIDSVNNTITINDNSGSRLMTLNQNGTKFWRDEKEIGNISVTKGAGSDTYGLSFNLKEGDAMTWSVYNIITGYYDNKLRYEQDSKKLIINGNLDVNGDIINGNIMEGITTSETTSTGTNTYRPVTGIFDVVTEITENDSGGLNWRYGQVKIVNGMVVSWPINT